MDPRRDSLGPRRRAAELFTRGLSRAEVARLLRVSRATTTQWYRLWKAGGADALAKPARPGRPPRLDVPDLTAVQHALTRSPRVCGYDLERWTLAAVVALIARTTGVAYHPRHVRRVLLRMGWVIPPVGPTAPYAFRQYSQVDPDGNEFHLRQHWRGE